MLKVMTLLKMLTIPMTTFLAKNAHDQTLTQKYLVLKTAMPALQKLVLTIKTPTVKSTKAKIRTQRSRNETLMSNKMNTPRI